MFHKSQHKNGIDAKGDYYAPFSNSIFVSSKKLYMKYDWPIYLIFLVSGVDTDCKNGEPYSLLYSAYMILYANSEHEELMKMIWYVPISFCN